MPWLFLAPYEAGEVRFCPTPTLMSSSERGAGESLIKAAGACRKSICDVALAGHLPRWKRESRRNAMADFTAQGKNWTRRDRADSSMDPLGMAPLPPEAWHPFSTRDPTCGCLLLKRENTHSLLVKESRTSTKNASD